MIAKGEGTVAFKRVQVEMFSENVAESNIGVACVYVCGGGGLQCIYADGLHFSEDGM